MSQYIRLGWNLGSHEIQTFAANLIRDWKHVQETILKLPREQQTFKNCIVPFALAEGSYETGSSNCHILSQVSPDKVVREASLAANKQLEEFSVETFMNKDLFKLVLRVKELNETLTDKEDYRLLERLERDFQRNGMALAEEHHLKLETLKKRLTEVCLEFQSDINEDTTTVQFDELDLEGLPQDFLDSLEVSTVDPEKNKKKYILTMKYPHLLPVMRKAAKEKTRFLVDQINNTRCKRNLERLKEVLSLRLQIAGILGYESHAEFQLEISMAKNPKKVMDFLMELHERLVCNGKKELQRLIELKKEDKSLRGEDYDGTFGSWDWQYYHSKLLEEEHNIHEEEIKEYFPLETVTQNLFKIYQQVLGLKFTRIDNPSVWHEEVKLFQVTNERDETLVGFFYLDLHPREGKYSHAACFPLQPGMELEHGDRQFPVAAMVANLSKASRDKPSLLRHDEVVTYFHEFGHVMHHICARTKWSRFHGTSVERDFVEAPSQWCWEPEILQQLSKHYKTQDPIPRDLIDRMVQAKNVDAGLVYLRQLHYALFDMKLHTLTSERSTDIKNINTTELWHRLRDQIALIPGIPNTFPESTFAHLVGGYDAGYYGYLWSQVFSADMFYSKFKSGHILEQNIGLDYRRSILQPGGSRDGMESLIEFLGREPRQDSFLTSIGIDTK